MFDRLCMDCLSGREGFIDKIQAAAVGGMATTTTTTTGGGGGRGAAATATGSGRASAQGERSVRLDETPSASPKSDCCA